MKQCIHMLKEPYMYMLQSRELLSCG